MIRMSMCEDDDQPYDQYQSGTGHSLLLLTVVGDGMENLESF